MTLTHHCDAIQNLITKGSPSDDSSYSLRLIAHFLNVTRALLIEQKADKYHYISEQSFQSLCVDLELGSFHNCCEGPDTKCKVLKSKTKLPKFLNTRWGDFAKVMTLDGEVISKSSMTINKYAAYSLTSIDKETGWFIHDNYLYVINNKSLEKVLLSSLFTNPEDIEKANCETSTNALCQGPFDAEYPIDADLIPIMYKMTMEFLLQSVNNIPPKDNENDSRDSQTSEG